LGDELGGHLVTGISMASPCWLKIGRGRQSRWIVEAPGELSRYIAVKGSVALDGVSLTVNEVSGSRFGVNLIAHTLGQHHLLRLAPAHGSIWKSIWWRATSAPC
jgi:riboflavin synthase